VNVNSNPAPQPAAETQPDSALRRAMLAAQTAAENRGRDIVILDVRRQTALFDYFVLATGTSRRQIHAMSEEIDHALEDQMGDRRLGVEGYDESRWILLDYGDVVIHLFDDETRVYYALEDLWAQAKRVPFRTDEESPGREPPAKPQ
jgi:ribosome-associated protein